MRKKGATFIDWYSLIHISAGILIGLVLKLLAYDYGWGSSFKNYMIIGVVLLMMWELFEISLRSIKRNFKKFYKFLLKFLPGYIFLREGMINIVGDIVIGVVGLLVIYWIF